MTKNNPDNCIDDILDETLNDLISPTKDSVHHDVKTLSNEPTSPKTKQNGLSDMSNLLKDLDESSDINQVVDQLLKSVQDGVSQKESENDVTEENSKSHTSSSFQERLKKANSHTNNTTNNDTDDPLEKFVDELCSVPEGAEFQQLIDGMIQQLMSKDILYEPMKELSVKYPEWIKSHRDTDKDIHIYEKQLTVVKSIVLAFDDPVMSESSKAQRVAELMDEMQQLGQPPASLLSQLAPGMDAPFLNENSGPAPQCSIM